MIGFIEPKDNFELNTLGKQIKYLNRYMLILTIDEDDTELQIKAVFHQTHKTKNNLIFGFVLRFVSRN